MIVHRRFAAGHAPAPAIPVTVLQNAATAVAPRGNCDSGSAAIEN